MSHRLRPKKLGIPSVGAVIASAALGASFSVPAALWLDAEQGLMWILALIFVVVILGFGLLIDPGRRDNMARDRDPHGVQPWRMRVVLVFLLSQYPVAGWRFTEGDPQTRAAKAYVDTILQTLEARLASEMGNEADLERTAPDLDHGLPPDYLEHGLLFGDDDGLWVQIERGGELRSVWRRRETEGWGRAVPGLDYELEG